MPYFLLLQSKKNTNFSSSICALILGVLSKKVALAVLHFVDQLSTQDSSVF